MANPFSRLSALIKAGSKVKPLSKAEDFVRSGKKIPIAEKPRAEIPEPIPREPDVPPPDTPPAAALDEPAPGAEVVPRETPQAPPRIPGEPEPVPRIDEPIDDTTVLEAEQTIRATEQKRLGGEPETNINFKNINSEEDLFTMADEVSRQSKARGQQRPRTTLEEISIRAGSAPIESLRDIIGDRAYRTAEKVLQPHQLIAVRDIWVTLADDLSKQATKITKNQHAVADEELVIFRENVTKFRVVQEIVEGQTRFAGQLLGSLRIKGSARSPLYGMEISANLESLGGRDVAMALAGDISRAHSVKKVGAIAKKGWLAKSMQVLDSFRYNSMLSAPETHGRNIAGNMGALAVRFVEKPIAAVAGSARRAITGNADSALHGQDRQAYLQETIAEIGSLPYGIVEGVRLMWKGLKDPDFKVGQSSTMTEVQFRPNMLSTRWAQKNVLTKTVAFMGDIMLLNGATRALGAMDVFFKGVMYQADASARAVRQAMSEGLDGKAFEARVVELASTPHADLFGKSLEAVEEATFTTRLEGSMADISRGIRKVPGGTIVVPFMRVLVNLTKWSISRTFPLNVPEAIRAFKAGGIEADQMVAKLATGTLIAYMAYDGVRQGKITGGGMYMSKKQRSMAFKSGWRPYSIYDEKTKEYTSLRGFAPVSTVYFYYASAAEAFMLSGDASIDEYFASSMSIFAAVTIDQTFVRGMYEWMQAINDPIKHGQRPIQSLASTAVPNWLRTIRRAMDPEKREKKTGTLHNDIINALIDKTPGLSESLPPATDYMGRAPEPGYQIFDMTPGSKSRYRDIYRELMENGISKPRAKPKLKIGGAVIDLYELHDERGPNYAFYQWQRYMGRARRTMLTEVIGLSEYRNAPAGAPGSGVGSVKVRGDYLSKAETMARQQALEQLAERYPSIEPLIRSELEQQTPITEIVPPQLRRKRAPEPKGERKINIAGFK